MILQTETKILIAIAIATCLIIGGSVFFLSKSPTPNTNINQPLIAQEEKVIDYTNAHKIGKEDAKVRLVEYSDLQCPACASFQPQVRELLKEYPENMLFVYKHFPLPQHANALKAAKAAEAAGEQGKFFEFHDVLFASQRDWEKLEKVDEYFLNVAGNIGLDTTKFSNDLNNPNYESLINAHVQEGNQVGVNATPTFFINNKKVNLTSDNSLAEAVKQELAK